MTDTAGPPPPAVWPCFSAHDARGLIAFLVEAFGFEETAVYGDGDRVDHAELSWPPGGGVMMGSAKPGDKAVAPGAFRCYVVVPEGEAEALLERARSAGATIILELTKTNYGSTDFGAKDPEGNTWYFGTYPGEPRKPR